MVVSEFLVDLVVDLVEPMVQSVPRREVDGEDLVGVGQTGPTELTGEDVGQGFEEGGVGGLFAWFIDKGGVMEEAPTGRPPEASVHESLLGGGTFDFWAFVEELYGVVCIFAKKSVRISQSAFRCI